jgi:hypothetical protein
MHISLENKLWAIFLILLGVMVVLWAPLKNIQSKWMNVPPAPGKGNASGIGLGDDEFAYRAYGIMLQNLGDSGGRVTSLNAYNYKSLGEWFFLLDDLNDKSSFAPYIAAYYYGAASDGKKIRPLISYLESVGDEPSNEKWRWLAQAVYLARYKLEDIPLALRLSKKLATMADQPGADMPNWTRQMPAFILNASGDKEAAYAIMVEILRSVGDKLHPNEVNHTRAYICEDILSSEEAKENPLCEGVQ